MSKAQPTIAHRQDDRPRDIEHERLLIDEARRDAAAGRVIADRDVDRWLDDLVAGKDLPTLKPGVPNG